MTLMEEINEKRMEIRTDGYAMSVGEWISLYEKGELDIHPEFQRFYRWTATQKSMLIESILLGIPIPPIFVSQRSDGVWDVVDGLQRLSTIFQLVGILKDEASRGVEALVLDGTKYLPSLEKMRWDDTANPRRELPSEAKLLIKRAKISVSIVLKESDPNAKFDLFQRLNTGGSQLSPQEVRNCLLVMLNDKMYRWLRKLANYENFQQCVALSDRPLEEGYDVELVLRFLVFVHIEDEELKSIGDVGVFLTKRMSELASGPFAYKTHGTLFRDTFDFLAKTIGDNAFKRYNAKKHRHEGGFLLSQYEVVALGVGHNLSRLPAALEVSKLIQAIWANKDYTAWAGSGITATRRLPRLIPLGRRLFRK